jgi:hypothetical protein
MFRNYLLLTVSLLFSFSCDKVAPSIDIDQHDPELVVISNFTNGREIEVVVSSTRSLTDQSYTEYLLDATVELYEGDTYLETLQLIEPKTSDDIPYYSSPEFRPVVNVIYHLKVSAPGFQPITSQSRIPPQISIISLQIDNLEQASPVEGRIQVDFDLNLHFEDPIENVNYYHISLIQQYHQFGILENGDTSIISTYTKSIRQSPEINTNFEIAHLGGGILLSDEPFDGKVISYSMPVTIDYNPANEILGKLFIDLRAVSEEYFLYFQGLSRTENASGSPFTDPVFIFDNIDGGKGIFAGYNSSLDSLQISN